MAEISDLNITNSMAEKIAAPFELELEAFFNVNESAVMQILEKSIHDGTTPEEFINQIDNLFSSGENVSRVEKGGFMPIPEPQPGEGQDEYINRCMIYQDGDDLPDDQKMAVCFEKYREAIKSAFMDNVRKMKEKLNG